MNTTPVAAGLAFLSGSGASGRTAAAIGAAARLARMGHKSLYFDLCFGWGGLNLAGASTYSYQDMLSCENASDLVRKTDFGFDMISCAPPAVLDPDNSQLNRIVYLIHQLGAQYDHIILDPPASAQPLSLLAAAICEDVVVLVKPDAASVASSYGLIKTLDSEDMSYRCRIAFTFVDSPDEAAELKSKFDLLTRRFLKKTYDGAGFIYTPEKTENNFNFREDVTEFISLAAHLAIDKVKTFQNEASDAMETSQVPV